MHIESGFCTNKFVIAESTLRYITFTYITEHIMEYAVIFSYSSIPFVNKIIFALSLEAIGFDSS